MFKDSEVTELIPFRARLTGLNPLSRPSINPESLAGMKKKEVGSRKSEQPLRIFAGQSTKTRAALLTAPAQIKCIKVVKTGSSMTAEPGLPSRRAGSSEERRIKMEMRVGHTLVHQSRGG